MFLLYAVTAGLILGVLLGGNFNRFSSVPFRWKPIFIGGLLVQVVLFHPAVAARVGEFGVPVYVGSTIAVLVAVLRNVRLPGFAVLFLGGLSNISAIVANGGYMPASPEALAALGAEAPEIYSNSAVLEAPALQPLTDVFAMPSWMPFANVFSIGDVLIGIGVIWALVAIMRQPEVTAAGPAQDHGAIRQLTLVRDYPGTESPLAPWDSRRSVPIEGHAFLRWQSVQGKPVVRRGTQS